MKRTINSIEIKIADKYPIEKKFEFDDKLLVVLKGSVVKKDVKDNQDGTVDLILHFKALDYQITKE